MLFASRPSAPAASSDRRRARRVEPRQAQAKIDSKTFPLSNVSTAGFLITPYDGDLVARQRVYLTLMLKVQGKDYDFTVDAQVVRLKNGSCAGHFNNLRPDARRTIERLAAHR